MWVGIAEVTKLTRVSRLAKDKDQAFQAESFVRILSMTKSKALLSLLFMMMGLQDTYQNCWCDAFPTHAR